MSASDHFNPYRAVRFGQLFELLLHSPVSETVDVTSAAPVLQTESASVATVAVRLPHGKLAVASAYQEKRILAFDDAGVLYLSTNNGKRWKTIKPKWIGRIDTIRAAETGRGFELTTEDDAVWRSPDGSYWRRR
jgi:photosystem II stability/assembly factor-like uncharacterized protein